MTPTGKHFLFQSAKPSDTMTYLILISDEASNLMSEPSPSNSRLRSLSLWIRKPVVRLTILVGLHLSLFSAVLIGAFWLRYDFNLPPRAWNTLLQGLPIIVGMKLVIFYSMGHFHGWWRYVTFGDLIALFRATVVFVFAFVLLSYVASDWIPTIPRSVVFLDATLTVLVIGSLRSSWRLFEEQLGPVLKRKKFRPALLIGCDHMTGQLASQVNARQGLDFRIKAFVAVGDFRKNARLGHLPVAGEITDIIEIARKYRSRDILVPTGTLPAGRLRELVEQCNQAELTLKILPPLDDVLQGSSDLPMRSLNISDLLRRDPVSLDDEAIGRLISGRRVMVTGAGGSIGSEICRQIIAFAPEELILVGKGENRIFAIEAELRSQLPDGALVPVIADITDRTRMESVFERRQPEIVIHAAAHKHVPLMELHPGEAIKNNSNGTRILAELADHHHVNTFVLISTDKAVRPTSVMGATKALAERIIHAIGAHSDTKFCAVRFGNVLGSAGSVVPTFQDQIRRGGPITITDERMTRFFMSIPEASQLVLQSAAMAKGGEIFVLDMGTPIRIVDLARDVIRLSGLPADSIDIRFIGTRPGEKMYEELHSDAEKTMKTEHSKVCAVYQPPYSSDEVLSALKGLLEHANTGTPQQLRSELFAALDLLGNEKAELLPAHEQSMFDGIAEPHRNGTSTAGSTEKQG